ncbi:MAG: glucose-1-phosphate adenylyltransferase [Rubrivivax sp.]|nr:glucose-1-phosphate adenylyltransferase [Rubrivivax sp.]
MVADLHHHLAQHTYAVVLAGGRGTRLCELTDHRAKPAVPFAGKLNIIDFTLSNCVNSGVRSIAVLTQYKSQSLIRHIERGWSFLAASLGEYVDVVPAQQQMGEEWYTGTANALYQNLELIREAAPKHVLVLGGDHIYKMDYSVMLAEHVARGAKATVACIEVAAEAACEFGVMTVDADAQVLSFHEKPTCPPAGEVPGAPVLASMGIYAFDADYLIELLERDAANPDSLHDFGHDIIPWLVRNDGVYAHRFRDSCVNMVDGRPYWRDVGTVDAYWEANMDLTQVVPELNLYDDDWPILSQQRQLPPVKFVFDEEGRRGMAVASLVSGGCIISGATVRRSILFAKVRIAEGSVIEDSLLLPNVVVGRDVHLRRAIIDKHCRLPDRFSAGIDPLADRERGYRITERGITLVTPAMLGQPTKPG